MIKCTSSATNKNVFEKLMIHLYLHVLRSKLFLSSLCSETNYSMKINFFIKNDSISKQTALRVLFEVKKLVTYIKKSL